MSSVHNEGSYAPPPPRTGGIYGREHDGTYLKNWNPLMLAEDLPEGKIIGRDFLGTRVIVYRGPDGRPVVQSAYCPHVGADLAEGCLVEGAVRCAYHHWRFGPDGDCVEIPGETHIPRAVRIYPYPAAERWGLIWAFNGETPLFDLPEFPDIAEEDLYYRAFYHGKRPVEGWISSSNLVDFQHLQTVHNIPDPMPTSVDFGDHIISVRRETDTRSANTNLYGGTWLAAHTQLDGTDRYFMAGSSQLAPGWSESFFVVAMPRSRADALGEAAASAELEAQANYMDKLYGEDEPILFSIRFRGYGKSALIRSDKYFGQFLQYMERYPRSAPFDV
ncbi:MAG TPA: Rieske 2Fe-2S domain-containing protein [Sphingomonadaceae bacterium]|nr:Rieske 2Fe-2S domain-containing protein [Sphingomonadaceae bacterium]